MKAVYEGPVVILPRNEQIADVFFGKGWNNHSVYTLDEKREPKLLKGRGISQAEHPQYYGFLKWTLQGK